MTFADNRSAALAFTSTYCENDKRIRRSSLKTWFVEPANTWHQQFDIHLPNDNAADDIIEEPELFKLNEDCFRHLFKFCDLESLVNLSQVCTFFNELLIDNKSFKHIKTLTICSNEENDNMTLSVAREYLRRVGRLITKLQFEFDSCSRWNLKRYLEKINQYVGDNIRELDIMCYTDDYLPLLAQLCQHLYVLKVWTWKDYHYNAFDFQMLCPNLTKLKLVSDMNYENSCRPWHKLKYLSIYMHNYDLDFYSIIESNPQLIGVKFTLTNDQQVRVILNNLFNIEKLTICTFYKDISLSQLNNLNQFEHLTEFTLFELGPSNFNEILSSLIEFKQLRVLKLHIQDRHSPDEYLFNQREIIDLARKLRHLEKLLLFHIKLDESTLVDLIRLASNLKTFHMHDCYAELHSSLIWSIVNARESHQHTEPLALFLDSKKEWEKFLEKEIRKHIQGEFQCTHPTFGWYG